VRKIIPYCLTLLSIGVAWGQISPSGDSITLYELDQTRGKYVLSVNFELPEKGKSSFVVIGDTFEVQPRTSPRGGVCSVLMSNVYVLQTKFEPSATNELVQSTVRFDKYLIPFPEHTKLVFKNSVVELSKWKDGFLAATNTVSYEGEDALRQLKKMGMEPPPDMDLKNVGGHQTQKNRQ
jgi:hypothetical protein